ncbi:MAG: hypothetical protein WCJ61_16545 [Paludibacter sp.]
MNGQGATTISIKAIGIVKDIAQQKIFIEWKLTDLKRNVEARGAFATIHGSYSYSDS